MDELDLLDWKRRIFALYAAVRADDDPRRAWELWRTTRDELFASHPQTPLTPEQRASFDGLPYFDYDPGLRVLAAVEPAERLHREIATSGATPYPYTGSRTPASRSAARSCRSTSTGSRPTAAGSTCFADGTSGGGKLRRAAICSTRSRAPTWASADGRLVLDFNFAYNPSCSYDPRWVCPLAPPGNRLERPVRGGERLSAG